MFDDDTRAAARVNLNGFGDALAGRGASINQAIGAFRPLLRDVIPVARNLASPETDLPRFVRCARPHRRDRRAGGRGAGAAVRQPRRARSARCAACAPFIQESISEGPATLDAGIEQFPLQRPFLANTAALFRELQPGARGAA